MFADVLTSLGHLDGAALRSLLLRHERSAMGLGEYLVSDGIISAAVLQEALARQATLQSSMQTLIERRSWRDSLEKAV